MPNYAPRLDCGVLRDVIEEMEGGIRRAVAYSYTDVCVCLYKYVYEYVYGRLLRPQVVLVEMSRRRRDGAAVSEKEERVKAPDSNQRARTVDLNCPPPHGASSPLRELLSLVPELRNACASSIRQYFPARSAHESYR